MSDLLILTVISIGTVWALWRPWIGAALFAWVSLMSPHVEFGWRAADWPVATGIAACTLVGLLVTKERQNPLLGPPAWAILLFMLWTCITLPFSFFFDESLFLWQRSMKIWLMVFVTIALVNDRRKLDWLIWTLAFSVGFYGVKGGLFTLMTGGNYRVWGPGGFIHGNNELALAVVMTIPLLRYIQLQMTTPWRRRALGACIALSAIMVLGSYSRGAFLALAAMGFMLWLKGRHKFVTGVAMLVIATAGLAFMPDQWFERMNTIETYNTDDSALGRLHAWKMAWNLACDRLLGGGFMIYMKDVYAMYSDRSDLVLAAHSIYFQVMGEHGFIGLFLFLMIGLTTWIAAGRMKKIGQASDDQRWLSDLGGMIQVSCIGYGVAGAFLSLAYFDLPYYLSAVSCIALHIGRQQQLAVAKAARQAQLPAGMAMATKPY